jgi:biopolymer transport protein ExbB
MLHFILAGGICMIPLSICGILAVAIIVERAIVLREVRAQVAPFLEEFNRLIAEGKLAEAQELCEKTPHPISRMFSAGLLRRQEVQQGKDIAFVHGQVEAAVSEAGVHAIGMLEKRMNMLAAISNLGPLFGFMGTVTGMISAFAAIAAASTVDVNLVASGISEALNTTAAGLVDGIAASLGYAYFTGKIEGFVDDLQGTANKMLAVMVKDMIKERYGAELEGGGQAG